MKEHLASELTVLVVAPIGRDAANACQVLTKAGISARACRDLAHLCAETASGAGALLVSQESFHSNMLPVLEKFLRDQPPWSDLSLIVVAGGEATHSGLTALEILDLSGTVTVLERPLRVITLLTAVRAALRARRRQYQVRDLLAQREAISKELQERALRLEESQSELVRTKQQISDHADELEHVVAERTARLRDTIAQLEAFSYSISHDMRGPLRAMRQYSEILIEENAPILSEDSRKQLDRIGRAAERLDRLVQDLLTYSRATRQEINLHLVDLDKLVREIVEQYPQFQQCDATITIDGPLAPVIGHDASLTQCIANLLGNAVKFVRRQTRPTIRVSTVANDRAVRLWVEDNGIGIAPENHARIFNIFERVNTPEAYDGTGIGLAIVKKTVERMGGEIGLESQLGAGSRFWIELPSARKYEPEYQHTSD